MNFNRVFHYKIHAFWGYHYFWKHLNGTHFGGTKQAANVAGNFGGFPENNSALFGLVSYNDPLFIVLFEQ